MKRFFRGWLNQSIRSSLWRSEDLRTAVTWRAFKLLHWILQSTVFLVYHYEKNYACAFLESLVTENLGADPVNSINQMFLSHLCQNYQQYINISSTLHQRIKPPTLWYQSPKQVGWHRQHPEPSRRSWTEWKWAWRGCRAQRRPRSAGRRRSGRTWPGCRSRWTRRPWERWPCKDRTR